MKDCGGLAAVGKVYRRAYSGTRLGIYNGDPYSIITGRPEVGGSALVHAAAATVNIALTGGENLYWEQADKKCGGAQKDINAFQTISLSNLFQGTENISQVCSLDRKSVV